MNPAWLMDGWTTLQAGVNSAVQPSDISIEQCAWSRNATFRGGYARPRPGWVKRTLDYTGCTGCRTRFQTKQWQGAGTHESDTGVNSLIVSVGGYIHTITLDSWEVSDITPTSNPNSDVLDYAWFCQAEQFALIQDGQSRCLIWDGAGVCRRSATNEIPVGGPMTYALGRIWLGIGSSYSAGDIVQGPNGTTTYDYRDSCLKWEENTYLASMKVFWVPFRSGQVTAMSTMATMDTSLGQGSVQIHTERGIYSNSPPYQRDIWIDTAEPLHTVTIKGYGAIGDRAVCEVNSDTYYRSRDGIRSVILARREAFTPGNTAMSGEEARLLDADSSNMLHHCSMVEFDNRLLCTAEPRNKGGRGVYHTKLAVCDFYIQKTANAKAPPAWEGEWSCPAAMKGILQLVKIETRTGARCFAFAFDSSFEVCLWELVPDATDDDGVAISWWIESRNMLFNLPRTPKKLMNMWLWTDEMRGTVEFDVKFRPDQYPCWIDWKAWQECAPIEDCATLVDGCVTVANAKAQYRPRVSLGQPPDDCDEILGKPYRFGFGFQVRLAIEGYARIRMSILASEKVTDEDYGACLETTCTVDERLLCTICET